MKLIYLAANRMFAWARLAARDSVSKDVEILILWHQLSVAQRRDPRPARKLTWPDRAWLALLAAPDRPHPVDRDSRDVDPLAS